MNPHDGSVLLAKAFDTHATSITLEAFIDKGFPRGYIIAAACKDDCARQLSDKGRDWFESLGSKLISELAYRQGFAFIGKIGSRDCNERLESKHCDVVSVTQII